MTKINDKLVWIFLIGEFILSWIPWGLKLNTVMYFIGAIVAIALLVVIEVDYRKVMKWYKEKTGEKKKPFGDIWILFFPAYLYKRNKLVGEKQTTFYASIASIVIGWVLGGIIVAAMIAAVIAAGA